MADWVDWGGERIESEGAADAERGVTPPSGPLPGGFAGGYAAAEKRTAVAKRRDCGDAHRSLVGKTCWQP